jgi:hypothetical protein
MTKWSGLVGIAVILGLIPRASAQTIGAQIPWMTYEAESAKTNATILGPDYTGQTAVREASGRHCVQLSSTFDYVEFTAVADAQGMVIRYNLPNSPDGTGIDATLSLYINGKFKSKLPMTSQYSYLYGKYPFTNQPSDGTPRHF